MALLLVVFEGNVLSEDRSPDRKVSLGSSCVVRELWLTSDDPERSSGERLIRPVQKMDESKPRSNENPNETQ